MNGFDYHRPHSLSEAARIFSASAEPRFLAGGQSLIPTLKLRLAQASDLIDLSRIPGLRGVKVEDGKAIIGAATPHAEVAMALEEPFPALARLAEGIGDPQLRNLGTIGGNIATNDPAADYPAALLALDAEIHTNRRVIPAADFFTGMFQTALARGEIIAHVALPVTRQAAYAKFRNPDGRHAMVGVFAARSGKGARVAVTGAAPCAFRLTRMEQALDRDFSPQALEGIIVPSAGLTVDQNASAEYRAHLVGLLARRAVAAAQQTR